METCPTHRGSATQLQTLVFLELVEVGEGSRKAGLGLQGSQMGNHGGGSVWLFCHPLEPAKGLLSCHRGGSWGSVTSRGPVATLLAPEEKRRPKIRGGVCLAH